MPVLRKPRRPHVAGVVPQRGQRLVIYDAGGAFERDFEWWARSTNGKNRLVKPRLPFDYGRSDGCGSITGGAFVPNGSWPAPYEGAYLFADYVCGRIFRLVPQGGGTYARADFASGLGASSAVHLEFGPAGSGQGLYYTTYAGGGEVRRIVHTGAANRAPTASLSASRSSDSQYRKNPS